MDLRNVPTPWPAPNNFTARLAPQGTPPPPSATYNPYMNMGPIVQQPIDANYNNVPPQMYPPPPMVPGYFDNMCPCCRQQDEAGHPIPRMNEPQPQPLDAYEDPRKKMKLTGEPVPPPPPALPSVPVQTSPEPEPKIYVPEPDTSRPPLIKPIPKKRIGNGDTLVDVYDYTLPGSTDEGDEADQEVTRILAREKSSSTTVPTTMNVYFQSVWFMEEEMRKKRKIVPEAPEPNSSDDDDWHQGA